MSEICFLPQSCHCERCDRRFNSPGAVRGTKHGVKCPKCGHLQIVDGQLDVAPQGLTPPPERTASVAKGPSVAGPARAGPGPPELHGPRRSAAKTVVAGLLFLALLGIVGAQVVGRPHVDSQQVALDWLMLDLAASIQLASDFSTAILPDELGVRLAQIDTSVVCRTVRARPGTKQATSIQVRTVSGTPIAVCLRE